MTKSVCLHAAFVRSPRENPWTGSVDPEDSAFPYRDWTRRAHSLTYGPLAFDPAWDADGRLRGAVNLYERLSFSFCPLLLAWLERAQPDTYRRILDGDRAGAARLGHGNALAQPYGAAPLPELSLRDKKTAVRWGREDFQLRFARAPEGIWLPGLAADEETLEVLVAEGFRFTILPAARAGRVRSEGDGEADWRDIHPDTFNPTRPYRWRSRLTPGAELAVFFPHERLCAALASGEALLDGAALWRSLRGRFLPDESTQLVHAATPGELYGLTHQRGPAVLGEVLRHLEADGLPLTNYAAYLDRFPPPQEVELKAGAAAAAAPWRPALRQGLRELAQALDGLYAEKAAAWLHDPWLARDAAAALLGRDDPSRIDDLLSRQSRKHLSTGEARQVLLLLELQRRRLLMLAEAEHDSAQISDAEPAQALAQACRAMELAAGFGAQLPPPQADAGLWSRRIAPSAVAAPRAAAHFALLEHLGVAPPAAAAPGERFSLARIETRRETASLPAGRDAVLSWTSLALRDGIARELREWSVCAHQLERLDLAAWALPAQEEPGDLGEAFARAPGEEFRAELGRRFGQAHFTLDALLADERLQVLRWLMPDPSGLRPRQAFLRDWAAAVGRLRREPEQGADLIPLLERCRAEGFLPDQLPWAGLVRGQPQASLRRFLDRPSSQGLAATLRWLAAVERVGLHVDVFELRCLVLLWQDRLQGACADPAQRELALALAEKLALSPLLFGETEALPS